MQPHYTSGVCLPAAVRRLAPTASQRTASDTADGGRRSRVTVASRFPCHTRCVPPARLGPLPPADRSHAGAKRVTAIGCGVLDVCLCEGESRKRRRATNVLSVRAGRLPRATPSDANIGVWQIAARQMPVSCMYRNRCTQGGRSVAKPSCAGAEDGLCRSNVAAMPRLWRGAVGPPC